MSTQNDYPTFNARSGERNLINVNFGPSLESGDHLTGLPSASTATLRGYSEAGSFTVSNFALEPGATPQRVSFLVETTAAHTEYRVDVVCSTQNGERKKVPVIIKVLP